LAGVILIRWGTFTFSGERGSKKGIDAGRLPHFYGLLFKIKGSACVGLSQSYSLNVNKKMMYFPTFMDCCLRIRDRNVDEDDVLLTLNVIFYRRQVKHDFSATVQVQTPRKSNARRHCHVAFDSLVTCTCLLFSFVEGWCCDYHDFESISTQR